MPLLIINANVVLEEEILPNGAVLVEDGLIRTVAPAEELRHVGSPSLNAHGA